MFSTSESLETSLATHPPSWQRLSQAACSRGLLTLVALYKGRGGLVLLDEPATGFDHSTRAKFRLVLQQLLADGETRCLVVTHAADLISQEDEHCTYYCSNTETGAQVRCLEDVFKGRQKQKRLEPDHMRIFFLQRVLFVEGSSDESVLKAVVHLAEHDDSVATMLKEHGIDGSALARCPIMVLGSSGKTAPVTVAAMLRIPRGVLLDNDSFASKRRVPEAIAQLQAICNDASLTREALGPNAPEEVELEDLSELEKATMQKRVLREAGVFVLEGEMEHCFRASPGAIRKLFNAAQAGDKASTEFPSKEREHLTDDDLLKWATQKKLDREDAANMGGSLHKRWGSIHFDEVCEAVKELLLGSATNDSLEILHVLRFWQTVATALPTDSTRQKF